MSALVVHLLRVPTPIDTLVMWCGRTAPTLPFDSVANVIESVTCIACLSYMRATRDALCAWEPGPVVEGEGK